MGANPTIAALLAKFPQRKSTTNAGSIDLTQAAADVAAGYAFSLFPDPNQYGPYGIVLTQTQVSAANKIPGMQSQIPGPWTEDTQDNGGCAAIMGVLPNSPVGDWGPMSASLNDVQNFFFSDSGLERFLSTIVTLAPPVSEAWYLRLWHWIEGLFGYGPNAVPSGGALTVTTGAVSGLFSRRLLGPGISIDAVGSLPAVLDSPVLRRVQTPMTIGGRPVVFEESDWRKLIQGHKPSTATATQAYSRAKACLDLTANRGQLQTVMAEAKGGNHIAQDSIVAAAHGTIVRMKMGAERLVSGAMKGDANSKAICRQIIEKAQHNPNDVKATTEARLISDTLQQQRAVGRGTFTPITSL